MSKFKLKTTPYAQAQFNSVACKSQKWDLKSKKKTLIKRNEMLAIEDEAYDHRIDWLFWFIFPTNFVVTY